MKNDSWDVRMDGDMVIAGLGERTREAYLRAVRQPAKFHCRADPGTLEEQHVKDNLLWRLTKKRAAPPTRQTMHESIVARWERWEPARMADCDPVRTTREPADPR